MKLKISLILALLSISTIIYSCGDSSTNTSESKLPFLTATITGAETLNFTSDTSQLRFCMVMDSSAHVFTLRAYQGSVVNAIGINIMLNYWIDKTGTYNNCICSFFHDSDRPSKLPNYSSKSGTLTISYISKETLKGTFNFQGTYENKTVNVTNGKFIAINGNCVSKD